MLPVNLHDYRKLAKKTMSPEVWDFVEGAFGDEVTKRRNRIEMNNVTVNPNFLVDSGIRNLKTVVLGEEISFPVMVAPVGGQQSVHSKAELASSKAANSAGTLYILPASSAYGMKKIRKATKGPLWFQLYHHSNEMTEYLLPMAEDSGYSAICLTIDVPLPGPRDRDMRNNFTPYDQGSEWGSLAERPDLIKRPEEIGIPDTTSWKPKQYGGLTWKRLEYFRSLTNLPLVLKGVRNVTDAELSVQHGVDAIIVSNHGGRQLDGTLSAIETLPAITDAVGDKLEVYFDSGIRRGIDVLRAIALGARAVLIGRPMIWGLAVDGEPGVRRVLELLRIEFDRSLAYCGINNVDQIKRSHVSVPGKWFTRI